MSSSRDFGFTTLRSMQAYQSNGARVPPNYILTTGENGAAIFTNNVYVSSINASSAVISTLSARTINVSTLYTDLINASSINTSSLNAININTSSLNTSSLNTISINTSSINTSSLNSNTINTSSINTSTITVTSLIALPTATNPSNVLYTAANELYFNGLRINTGVISTVSSVYWTPAGDGTTGVITNDNEGNPLSNPLRYLVGVGTNFGADTRSTLNGTLDIQYRGGNQSGNSLFISSNGNTFDVNNVYDGSQNGIKMDLTDNQTASFGPALHFNKSLGLGPTQDGNELGYVEFDGTDTTSTLRRAAYMISRQQGAAGSNFVPGTLEFFTTAGALSAGGAQRMIISSSGQVGINTSAPYKQFQVSTTTQDALDGIASNSADVNTIIGAYGQGPFSGDNVGSIQVTRYNNSTTPYTLALNPRGGDVYIGSSISNTFINGNVSINTLTVQTINGQVYDPTQDTHWTGYLSSGILNVFNANNGVVGIGTGSTITNGVQFQVNGASLFNGQISTSNLTTPYVSSVNNVLVLGGEVYISSSLGDDYAQLSLFNGKAQITTDAIYDGMYLEASGNAPIILASTLGGASNNIYATFGPTSTIINGRVNILSTLNVASEGNFTSTSGLTNGTIGLKPDGDNGNVIRFGGSGPNADNLIFTGSANLERMRINGYGQVGIGTNNPQYQLDVAGNIYASTNLITPYVSTSIINMSSIGASNGQIIGLSTINGIAWPPIDDALWSGSVTGNITNDNTGAVIIKSNYPLAATLPTDYLIEQNVNIDLIGPSDAYPVLRFNSQKAGGGQNKSLTLTMGDGDPTWTSSWEGFISQDIINNCANFRINGNLVVSGSAVAPQILTTLITTDPGVSGPWANYYGRYSFINGTSPFTLTLPTTSVTEGSVLIFRNLDSNPVTIVNVLSGGSPLAANGSASFVYTLYAPGGATWVSL